MMIQRLIFIASVALCSAKGLNYQIEEVNVLQIERFEDNEVTLNDAPVIGVLAQSVPYGLTDFYPNAISFISASYVKFLESAGAKVVPILTQQPEEYYLKMFNSTNGLLIPGGSESIYDSDYARAGKLFYKLAMEALENHGDYYPIWGTCLGFELLALVSNNDQPNLKRCYSMDQYLPLNFTDSWSISKIGSTASDQIQNILTSESVTANFHQWCLTPLNFTHFNMDKFWTVTALGKDLNDLEFIAMMEAKDYPFYGVQFHPEKNAYEWPYRYPSLPHSSNAVKTTFFFASFFVDECRKNLHSFESREDLEKRLIYNYSPEFTGNLSINYPMVSSYLFMSE